MGLVTLEMLNLTMTNKMRMVMVSLIKIDSKERFSK